MSVLKISTKFSLRMATQVVSPSGLIKPSWGALPVRRVRTTVLVWVSIICAALEVTLTASNWRPSREKPSP